MAFREPSYLDNREVTHGVRTFGPPQQQLRCTESLVPRAALTTTTVLETVVAAIDAENEAEAEAGGDGGGDGEGSDKGGTSRGGVGGAAPRRDGKQMDLLLEVESLEPKQLMSVSVSLSRVHPSLRLSVISGCCQNLI